jgi:nitroreductase
VEPAISPPPTTQVRSAPDRKSEFDQKGKITMASPARSVQTDYPVLPVIAERWSPYVFEPRPVERQKLLACLEAARWAPSSYNEQPWTFLLAERTDAAGFEQMLGCLVEGNRAWAKNAGVLLLTIVARFFTLNGKPNRAAEHDIGLASENMVLQAAAVGLAGHQMIGIEPAKIRATYGIPDTHEPLTAIALGYAGIAPADDPLAVRDASRRPRKAISEIVFSRWGQPADLKG